MKTVHPPPASNHGRSLKIKAPLPLPPSSFPNEHHHNQSWLSPDSNL